MKNYEEPSKPKQRFDQKNKNARRYKDIDEPEINIKVPKSKRKEPFYDHKNETIKHTEDDVNIEGHSTTKYGEVNIQGNKDTIHQSNHSITSSVVALQNKLQNVQSPSSSKEGEEDDYDPEIDEDHLGEDGISSDASASIPMAHREYEKTLRQLEAECRTHIKCEQ